MKLAETIEVTGEEILEGKIITINFRKLTAI